MGGQKKIIVLTVILCALTIRASAQTCADYGIPVNGYPNWQERAMLVATNAVRVSPYQYRDYYLAGFNVLTPAWYSPVAPLQWSDKLAHAARYHSSDLANTPNCAFQHNSCDGTNWITEITRYYPNWASIGQNVAGGYWEPWNTVNGLILDSVGGVPASDGSNGDGHRRTLMSSPFTELGIGYTTGPNPMLRYWTQDFGRGQTLAPICSSIYSGSHVFVGSNVVFMMNFYDSNNANPQSVSLVLNGVSIPMNLHLGTVARGTYRYDTALTASCRPYHYEVRNSAGILVRHPTRGEFETFGDGCDQDYMPAAPVCAVDFDGSGRLTTDDIFSFIDHWFVSDPRADFNHSGALEPQDIFDFINAWFVGCPAPTQSAAL